MRKLTNGVPKQLICAAQSSVQLERNGLSIIDRVGEAQHWRAREQIIKLIVLARLGPLDSLFPKTSVKWTRQQRSGGRAVTTSSMDRWRAHRGGSMDACRIDKPPIQPSIGLLATSKDKISHLHTIRNGHVHILGEKKIFDSTPSSI